MNETELDRLRRMIADIRAVLADGYYVRDHETVSAIKKIVEEGK